MRVWAISSWSGHELQLPSPCWSCLVRVGAGQEPIVCEEEEEKAGCSRGTRGLSRHSSPRAGVNLTGGKGGSSEGARSEVEGREEEEESGKRKEKVGRKERKKRKKKGKSKYAGLGSGFCVIRFFC